MPKVPKIPGGVRALLGRAAFLKGAYDTGEALYGQADRSVEDIQGRGGFVSSTLQDAFPTLGKIGKSIGDTVGEFVHGPIAQYDPNRVDPEAEQTAQKQPPVVPDASASATASVNAPSSRFDDLLAAQLGGQGQPEPAAVPAAAPNESYFINNQGGEKPGEKQYFRNLPGTTLNDPQPQTQLPQRLPTAQGQSPTYESPMVEATKNLNLARFDGHKDSFGDLLSKRLHNVSEGQKLLPALAQTREMEEQQRRSEEDRGFNLEALELSQNKEYDDNNLALGRDELVGRDKRSALDNLVRLRGQDVVARTSQANASTRAAADPLTFTEQLEEDQSLEEINRRDYINAPKGFPEAVSTLIQNGATRAQVRNAFNSVSADQSLAWKTPVNELDVQKLYNAVKKELGQ